jgi:CPA2 family monovalent cation:H+ antiporter-2
VGSAVAGALETFGIGYVAIEKDPGIVASLRARGASALFGDATNPGVLTSAGADRAALVMVTLPEIERAHLAVRRVRSMNPAAIILARAHHVAGRDRLVEAGATEVIQPEFEAASTLIRHGLRGLALPRPQVLAYLDRYRRAMEEMPLEAAAPTAPLPEVRETAVGTGGLADQSLSEAHVRERFGVTVVAITRASGDVVHHPAAETVLRPGDRLQVFGLPEQFAAFEQALRGDE